MVMKISLIVLVSAFVKFYVMNGFVLCTCWSVTSNWHQSTFLWRNAEYIKSHSATSCQMLESGLFCFSFYQFLCPVQMYSWEQIGDW